MSNNKVVVGDDHPIFLEGVKAIFARKEMQAYQLVGTASAGDELLELVDRHQPGYLILELSLQGREGLEVIREVKKQRKETQILVLSRYCEPKLIRQSLKEGADGFIQKRSYPLELKHALRKLGEGKRFIGHGIDLRGSGLQISGRSSRTLSDRFIKKFQLTRRESEVLELISIAKSTKKIAEELFISDQTVSVHRKNIMRKLGVNSTAELIKVAIDNDLV